MEFQLEMRKREDDTRRQGEKERDRRFEVFSLQQQQMQQQLQQQHQESMTQMLQQNQMLQQQLQNSNTIMAALLRKINEQ